MNILHLYSDWKWTGPADPVLNICKKLQERGHKVTLAYRKPPEEYPETIERSIEERGINGTDIFNLNRFFSVSDNVSDVIKLRRFILDQNIELINTHLSHDHVLGGISGRLTSKRIAIIRTDHKRDSFSPTFSNKFLLTSLTDGIITFSERSKEILIKDLLISENKITRINPAIDTYVFNPHSKFRDIRKEFDIKDQDIVVGIVTRFQRYRKMDLFFNALSAVVKKLPNVKALLLGTSSQMKETVYKPVKDYGLEKNVIIAGYLTDRYIDALACMDIFVFLIAGSDGTGRALREVMSIGKPVIVNNVGMLPEMIDDNRSGLIFNNNSHELAKLIINLARDEELRFSIGKAAYEKAQNDFSLDKQASDIESFYEYILQQKK